MRFFKNLDCCNITNNKNILSNLSGKGIDDSIPNLTSCKYYTVSEFYNSKNNSRKINIFHNNLNGLETKFESLHHFLSNDSTKFDIIAITETSQKKQNEEFFTNINLDGYILYSTPTNSSKGGTIIYTKNHNLYESIWIEIRNRSSKNIICGNIYRHPNDNIQAYNQFLDLESCLSKPSNENKEVYLCGDFNSDLLKLDKENNYIYKRFYELMCSYGFSQGCHRKT